MTAPALVGRVVVLTGATGGLGPVVAEQGAAAGATLVLCDRDETRLTGLVTRLALPSERVRTAAVDLTDADAVRRFADDTEGWHGHVDAVLHMVGGWRGGTPLPEAPADDWPWLVERVVTTTVNVVRAFAAPLKAAANGRFVTVSSPQACAPTSSNAAYAAAKAASDAWTLALADEFAGSSATANVVVVPAILTPQMREAKPQAAFSNFVEAEAIAETMVALCAENAPGSNGLRIVLPTRGTS